LPSTGSMFCCSSNHYIQGRNITLRHIRNGKELTQLIKDDNPDARYQETRFLPSTTVVFPGDRLILECQYSTLGKSTVTFGGYAAEDETCLAYLSYYPAVNTTSCGSMIDTRAFLELTEYIPTTSSASPSLSSDAVLSQEVANSSVLRAFYTNKYDFNADNTKKLLKFYDEHDQLGVCLGNGADSMKAIHSAPYVPLPVKASTCVGKPSVQIPPPITISTAIGSADAMSGNKNASAKDTLIVKPVTVPRMTSLKPNDLTSMAAAAVQRNAGMRRSAVCFAALSVVVAVITTAFNA
ncbi:putative DBH-like monooxygenase protein 1, partial [Hypsibius exemplaris]